MIKKTLVKSITCYQAIFSSFFPRRCRFFPTCSEYTKRAVVKHGFAKGLVLGLKRLLKCNPFFRGGVDFP